MLHPNVVRSVDNNGPRANRLPVALAFLAGILVGVGIFIFLNLAWLAR